MKTAQILFGKPGDFLDRHQCLCVAAVMICIATIDWIIK